MSSDEEKMELQNAPLAEEGVSDSTGDPDARNDNENSSARIPNDVRKVDEPCSLEKDDDKISPSLDTKGLYCSSSVTDKFQLAVSGTPDSSKSDTPRVCNETRKKQSPSVEKDPETFCKDCKRPFSSKIYPVQKTCNCEIRRLLGLISSTPTHIQPRVINATSSTSSSISSPRLTDREQSLVSQNRTIATSKTAKVLQTLFERKPIPSPRKGNVPYSKTSPLATNISNRNREFINVLNRRKSRSATKHRSVNPEVKNEPNWKRSRSASNISLSPSHIYAFNKQDWLSATNISSRNRDVMNVPEWNIIHSATNISSRNPEVVSINKLNQVKKCLTYEVPNTPTTHNQDTPLYLSYLHKDEKPNTPNATDIPLDLSLKTSNATINSECKSSPDTVIGINETSDEAMASQPVIQIQNEVLSENSTPPQRRRKMSSPKKCLKYVQVSNTDPPTPDPDATLN